MDSILQQSYRDFELIISDDASQDLTSEICRGYAANDSRVGYHRFHSNQGAASNFRNVFDMARAKYFKWAAYDDVCSPWLPSKVSLLSIKHRRPLSWLCRG